MPESVFQGGASDQTGMEESTKQCKVHKNRDLERPEKGIERTAGLRSATNKERGVECN